MELKFIAAAFAVFAMVSAAFAIAKIFCAALEGVARNPSAEKSMNKYAIIGGAMVEALGLFAAILFYLSIS